MKKERKRSGERGQGERRREVGVGGMDIWNGERERESSNSKTLMFKDSGIRSIWTYL